MASRKNKWKIILPLLIVGLLAAAYFWGGDAPATHPETEGGAAPVAAAQAPKEAAAKAEAQGPEEPAEGQTAMSDAEATPPEQAEDTGPETEQDQYHTDPVPEGRPEPVEPQETEITAQEYSCTISISCATVLNNMELCDAEKRELIPADGWILGPTSVVFYEGESVFDVLQRACQQQGVHMEYRNTPIYNSAYIEGIHNLYEFDVGELSGWMYSVNGWFPNYGCSRYQLSAGDVINWVYTCDLGYDVGGGYAAN